MFKPVSSLPLPKEDCGNTHESLPERFQNFFVDKVKKIISEMVSSGNDLTSISTLKERHCHVSFENFRPLSITDVKCLISKSNSTSCNLDPMPTSLVKKSVHKLAPIIQCIINKSFQTGIFPDSLKRMGRNNHLQINILKHTLRMHISMIFVGSKRYLHTRDIGKLKNMYA